MIKVLYLLHTKVMCTLTVWCHALTLHYMMPVDYFPCRQSQRTSILQQMTIFSVSK